VKEMNTQRDGVPTFRNIGKAKCSNIRTLLLPGLFNDALSTVYVYRSRQYIELVEVHLHALEP
jgi:hypothetical protein